MALYPPLGESVRIPERGISSGRPSGIAEVLRLTCEIVPEGHREVAELLINTQRMHVRVWLWL